ncbi:MAG TPA: hypothetical protein VN227_01040 [Methanoregula sp.]|nr:hypothetical protein [Methanoregula sp.]
MGAALDALMTMVRVPSNFPIILIGSCKDDLQETCRDAVPGK